MKNKIWDVFYVLFKGGAMKKVNLPKNCEFIQNLEKIRKNEFDLEKNRYNSICIIP